MNNLSTATNKNSTSNYVDLNKITSDVRKLRGQIDLSDAATLFMSLANEIMGDESELLIEFMHSMQAVSQVNTSFVTVEDLM